MLMVRGGLYLCWMGSHMLRGALKKQDSAASSPHIELTQSGPSFLIGRLPTLSNPKAIIYFVSVFSLFFGDNVGSAPRFDFFGLTLLAALGWVSVLPG
ncbi:LysE family transporter, partial [Salmonella enterica]|uniref:LysE family transporter n=1 Tax=Salmonella enterica TaxID=28901 RepID=UPI00398C48A7